MKKLVFLTILMIFSCTPPVEDTTIHLKGNSYKYEDTGNGIVYILYFSSETQVQWTENGSTEVFVCHLDQTTNPNDPQLYVTFASGQTQSYKVINRGAELKLGSVRFIQQ